jgi:hypothetical protein
LPVTSFIRRQKAIWRYISAIQTDFPYIITPQNPVVGPLLLRVILVLAILASSSVWHEEQLVEMISYHGMIKQFQSLIGSTQWAVQLGRLDVTTTTVMTLSSYHLNRAKRLVVGYLVKTKNAAICIHKEMPDFSNLSDVGHNWDHAYHPQRCPGAPSRRHPLPLGNSVQPLSSFVDTNNLFHDLIMGRTVTGTTFLSHESHTKCHLTIVAILDHLPQPRREFFLGLILQSNLTFWMTFRPDRRISQHHWCFCLQKRFVSPVLF